MKLWCCVLYRGRYVAMLVSYFTKKHWKSILSVHSLFWETGLRPGTCGHGLKGGSFRVSLKDRYVCILSGEEAEWDLGQLGGKAVQSRSLTHSHECPVHILLLGELLRKLGINTPLTVVDFKVFSANHFIYYRKCRKQSSFIFVYMLCLMLLHWLQIRKVRCWLCSIRIPPTDLYTTSHFNSELIFNLEMFSYRLNSTGS